MNTNLVHIRLVSSFLSLLGDILSIPSTRPRPWKKKRVTMRFSKSRKHFDYRGMKNKLKKSYTHVHQVEDVWIDCRIEEHIKRLDYCHLSVEKIENLNLVGILEDLKDDVDILDTTYEKNKVGGSPLPLIQWFQKENASIRTKFQSILANTNV